MADDAAPSVARRRGVAALAVLAALCAGCTMSSQEDGSGSASCAPLVTFEGRTYTGIGVHKGKEIVGFRVGAEVGTAHHPPCNDTGRRTDGTGHDSTAYRIDGLDPDVAVAVGGTPEDARIHAVHTDGELPAEIEEFLDDA